MTKRAVSLLLADSFMIPLKRTGWFKSPYAPVRIGTGTFETPPTPNICSFRFTGTFETLYYSESKD
jgi:hypothetical protein